MDDASIVRNRLKIEATIANAPTAYLDLEREGGLARFLWRFQQDGPVNHVRINFSDIPAQTETSKQIAKALKARGFRFLGPTTVYAFMQSTGMVNDHLAGCHRHKPCAELQRKIQGPCLKGMLTPAVEAGPADMTSVPSTLQICEQETGAEVRRVSSRDRSLGNCRGDANTPRSRRRRHYIPRARAGRPESFRHRGRQCRRQRRGRRRLRRCRSRSRASPRFSR